MTAGRADGTTGDAAARPRIARVLDEDPDLGEGLDPAQLAAARDVVRAATMVVPSGAWAAPAWPESVSSGFGLLVLDGLLLRRVRLADRFGVELLAAGDLLRPWQLEDSISLVPGQEWHVLEPARLAILDVDFIQRIGSFPQIAGQIVGRALRRTRHFALNLAIVQQPRVETRLHMLLWHLADRWGTVRPDGVHVPLRLTQTVLAELVAARRPTVSAALGTLEREGLISRTTGGWVLHGSPPADLTLVV